MPLQALHADATAAIVAVALCTIGVALLAFALVGGLRASREIAWAGLFAAAYGLRLWLDTDWAVLLAGSRVVVGYAHQILEYLVPLIGSMLFLHHFGTRWRRMLRVAVGAFAVVAAIGIPYELLTGKLGAGSPVIDSLVFVLLLVLFVNLAAPDAAVVASDRRLISSAALIFAVFVLNEHLRIVRGTFVAEPVGFLIFIGTFGYVIMRRTIADRVRLASVDGELATARKIQASILPSSTPSHPSLDFAVRYLPASDVAGDFYDFLDAGDGRIGVFIADVSGHGVPAALVASMLKVALAAHAQHASDPPTLLRELNTMFCGRLGRQFITASYAVFSDASVTIASAGHPPPLLRRPDATIEELLTPGPVLGRFRTATFSPLTVPFATGDTLILYSDGLTEARRRDEQWGEERLRASLLDAPADALAARIVEQVTSWSERVEDDVTLLVIRHQFSR